LIAPKKQLAQLSELRVGLFYGFMAYINRLNVAAGKRFYSQQASNVKCF